MPERTPTRYPSIIAGTTLESGTPNTGQIPYTLGGTHTSTKLSGTAGGDANFWPGAGRLDSVCIFPPASVAVGPVASGISLTFYDSVAAVSGGPLATSGHKVIAVISPATDNQLASPAWNSGLPIIGKTVQLGYVFTSGLCYVSTSGQLGFSVSFTPVVSG